jgi:hypothetical protein
MLVYLYAVFRRLAVVVALPLVDVLIHNEVAGDEDALG